MTETAAQSSEVKATETVPADLDSEDFFRPITSFDGIFATSPGHSGTCHFEKYPEGPGDEVETRP